MQYKRLILFLLVALVLMWPGSWVGAGNFNDFQTDSDVVIDLSDPDIYLTLKSGANLEEMVVNTGSVTLKVQSGSLATITSSDRRTLSTSYSGATFTCPNSGASSITVSASAAATFIITPSASQCGSSGGGGGGGGGAPPPPVTTVPDNTSIVINAGASETSSEAATLTLSANNANQMMLSNLSTFAGASWETYTTSKTWTLTSGTGTKTVYAKFRSSSDGISSAISDSIVVTTSLAAKSITKTSGGNVSLSDGSAGVSVPAGALSGDGIVSITPTASYSAAPSGKGMIGVQAYNFKAEVDTANVTNFLEDLTLTFTYTAEQIKNMDESTLAVYYYDETTSAWVKLGGTIDTTNKQVTVTTNHFTLFAVFGDTTYLSGDLVKLACDASNASICTAVYYLGNDGKRYVFPNSKTYATWYDDFSTVKTISASGLAAYTIGGNVNYRPGVKMVKIDTDPKVYAVGKDGALRWVKTEAMANTLYGDDWNTKIDDVPDAFFFNYTIGTEIAVASDYYPLTETASVITINVNKGL